MNAFKAHGLTFSSDTEWDHFESLVAEMCHQSEYGGTLDLDAFRTHVKELGGGRALRKIKRNQKRGEMSERMSESLEDKHGSSENDQRTEKQTSSDSHQWGEEIEDSV